MGKDYCDHIEEQMLPLEAWGTEAVLSRFSPRRDCSFDNDMPLWRIMAGKDNMTVYFDPALPDPVGSEYHFDEQGDWFEIFAPEDYFAYGLLDDPLDPEFPEASFMAYQLMAGAMNFPCTKSDKDGDPMMLLAPPAGQYLERYVFNTDNVFDYEFDEIIIVRPAGVPVVLECLGEALDDDLFTEVGSSDWEVGRFQIDGPDSTDDCFDGTNIITSEQPFGLSVVGFDWCQSYGYLGGIGVWAINPDPTIGG
jgi:hypothetical protein